MTFPVLEGTTRGASSASATSHNITLPATVNSGDILVVRFTSRGGTVTWDNTTAGAWTQLASAAHPSDGNFKIIALSRECDGSEDSAVLSIGLASSGHAAWHIDRFSGAQAVEASSVSAPGGPTTVANSANLNPSWPAEDAFWITSYGHKDGGVGSQTAPTNYSGTIADGSSGGSGGCAVFSAYRQLNADSEDPGAWSPASAPVKLAITFAVRYGKILKAPKLDTPVTFFSPSVVSILKPPLMGVGTQFLQPQVASTQVLAAPRLDVPVTFFGPAVSGGLIASRLDVGVTFFAPTVKDNSIKPPRVDAGVKFFKPLVEGGFRSIPKFTTLSFGPFPGAMSDAALYNNTFNAPLRFEDRWAVRGPLGYTDFQPFVASMYEFENAYVWLRLTLDQPAFPAIAITQARVNIDVPDLRDSGEADIPINGALVTFARTFNAPPDVVAQVINAVGVTAAPKVNVRQDITTTQFFAVCHTGDDTTASVAARIKWVAQGY